MTGSDNVEEDRRRAEVFDALSHPTRIMILKALSEEALGFADLKKKIGIESSGHMQHHLSKLSGLVKTDEYGKYILSDQGKDALLSVETVEKTAQSAPKKNGNSKFFNNSFLLKSAVVALALLLMATSVLVAYEYSQTSSLQNSISEQDNLITQLNSTEQQRDTLITQLDTALNLTQSRLDLILPKSSQYLTTLPDSNGAFNTTKIFLESSSAWFHYEPVYPFNITWFNPTTHYGSSVQMVPLTNNQSIPLSFYGWNIGDSAKYEYEGTGGPPYLMIGVIVRNDYTAFDAGNGSDPTAPIGNLTILSSPIYQSTSTYISYVNLTVRLISQDGSVIPTDQANGIQSPTQRGAESFPLASNETKQVVFYLYPSSLNVKGLEIYISYLSSVSP